MDCWREGGGGVPVYLDLKVSSIWSAGMNLAGVVGSAIVEVKVSEVVCRCVWKGTVSIPLIYQERVSYRT